MSQQEPNPMPLILSLRNSSERKVRGLRDSAPPPETYSLYHRMPDGTEVFIGEFPTPIFKYDFGRRKIQIGE